MNRRGFLSKICGLIPFGMGLAATRRSGACEGQRGGKIDNAMVFDKALSAKEIKCLANIDPNSEWVKQMNWDALGCKDCFVGCGQFDDCLATLREKVKESEETKNYWRFYINSEEVNSNRARDENDAMCWPFKGAKEGDLCTAKSPKVLM